MEVKRELEKLHEESFMWALACCDWNRAEAEEVLQTAYLKLFDGRARFEGRSSFKTWFFSVIRLTVLEGRRKSRVRDFLLMNWWQSNEVLAAEPVKTDNADKERLNAALARLPRRQREVLELVFYHEMTIAEAGHAMNVSVGTARTHYERGKKELQRLLGAREAG
jgi:RNA polymerase sigma-70 factor (ECF subfamily)